MLRTLSVSLTADVGASPAPPDGAGLLEFLFIIQLGNELAGILCLFLLWFLFFLLELSLLGILLHEFILLPPLIRQPT